MLKQVPKQLKNDISVLIIKIWLMGYLLAQMLIKGHDTGITIIFLGFCTSLHLFSILLNLTFKLKGNETLTWLMFRFYTLVLKVFAYGGYIGIVIGYILLKITSMVIIMLK